MEKEIMMEGFNEDTVSQVYESVSNSKGGIVTKIVVATVIVAAGVGAAVIYKKKKNKKKLESEFIESESENE